MAMQEQRRRRARGSSYDKLAISMPHRTVERAREQVKARGVPSLSAYITEVVEKDLAERTYDDILEEVFREKPMTDEERAWAERIILGR